jgi:ketosteroid isomerase-like protein
MQQGGTAESRIKQIIEAWADAVRQHDLSSIIAHHDQDIVMFDVPRRCSREEWMSTRKHGICSSGITSPHKRST